MPGVRPGALLGHAPGLWTPPASGPSTPTFAGTILATPGLVSFYRLNEPSGPTMADLTGVNNGSYVGTPTFGVVGPTSDGATGITIPSTADGSYGLAKTSAILAGLTNWTIEAWVKTIATAGPNGNCIYAERNASAGNDILKLEQEASGGHLRLTYRDDAGTLNQSLSTGLFNDGNWHLVALTKTGTALAYYIDGATSGTATLTATNTFTNVLRCQIGDDPVGVSTGFNGSLAAVALYNVAVPGATLINHWNAR